MNVIHSLYKDVPAVLYLVLLIIFVVSCVFTIMCDEVKHKVRFLGIVMLMELVVLLYCSTVLFRPVNDGLGYSMKLFDSYGYNNEERYFVLSDNVLNVAIYAPFCLLLGLGFKKIKWPQVLMAAFWVSASIEYLQYVLHKGYAEIDDVFHNVLGSLIGYGFYSLIEYGFEKVYKRRVAVL